MPPSLVPRPLFSVFICGDGKRVWWISIRRFVLLTPRFWESLIGVENYKGLFDKVSITIVACNYIITETAKEKPCKKLQNNMASYTATLSQVDQSNFVGDLLAHVVR